MPHSFENIKYNNNKHWHFKIRSEWQNTDSTLAPNISSAAVPNGLIKYSTEGHSD